MTETLLADLQDRTVRGMLLPWNEPSRQSNIGIVEFARGIVALPRDPSVVTANLYHKRDEPVGRATALEDTEAGLVATFKIAETDEGDQLLLDIEDGKLTKLSAEVKNVVRRGTKALSGALFGAAFVDEGAFKSAALYAELATTEEHHEDEFTDENGVTWVRKQDTTTTTDGNKTTTETTTVTEVIEPETPANTEGGTAVSVPTTLEASAPTATSAPSKREVLQIMEAVRRGEANETLLARLDGQMHDNATLFAALNDIKYSGTGAVVPYNPAPQWIGELWNGIGYQTKILDLLNHADLTSRTISGFTWTTKPQGGTWAGNKSNVPSNAPATAPYSATAQYFAGGHDHAIEFQVFDAPGYFESYYAAMAESYAQWADQTVALAGVLAGATTVEADNPAGLTIGAGFSALIDGAVEVMSHNAIPTFALVETSLWKSMLKTPHEDILGYLSASLKLTEGELAGFVIRGSDALPTGNILVGARQAATVYELPGVPIRVQAPDLTKGGIDTNVFGFAGLVVNKADALQLVTPYTA